MNAAVSWLRIPEIKDIKAERLKNNEDEKFL
jgi:hypothetical protein